MNTSFLSLILSLAVGVCATPVIHAATLYVPSQYPTIQSAIDASQAGDTVMIADGVYTGFGNKNIDFQDRAITVRSENGPESCVIDCENSGRGFVFDGMEFSGSVLDGVTITRGNVPAWELGGGILILEASPVIRNCLISSCVAVRGGGISIGGVSETNEPALLQNCEITNCLASLGGGVAIGSSRAEVQACVFRSNRVQQNPDMRPSGCGGAISLDYASIELTNSQLIDNVAANDGGALFFYNGYEYIVSDCIFSGNSAGMRGGGVYSEDTCSTYYQTRYSNCLFTDNIAGREGGGIWSKYCPFLEIGGSAEAKCTFAGNRAANGADLFSYRSGSVPMASGYNVFTGIHYSDYYVSPQECFDLHDSLSQTEPLTASSVYVSPEGSDSNDGLSWDTPFRTIRNALSKINPTADSPVSIYLSSGTFSPSTTGECFPVGLLDNVSIVGSSRDQTILDAEETASVLYGVYDVGVRVSDLTVRGGIGSGIDLANSKVMISRCRITENQGTTGGGINSYHSELIMEECTIDHNAASESGGGIYMQNDVGESDNVISECVFEFNTADQSGGGLFSQSKNLMIRGCRISNNHTGGSGGGGSIMPQDAFGSCRMIESEISMNRADEFGGGLFLSGAIGSDLITCRLEENFAGLSGGAVYSETNPLSVLNSLFIRNYAISSGGGLFVREDTSASILSSTIADNLTEYRGGGIMCDSGSLTVSRSIIWNNDPDPLVFTGASPSVTYTIISGGIPGVGNLDLDPRFAFGPLGEYYLSQISAGQSFDSPGLNTGDLPASAVCYSNGLRTICLDELITRTDQIPDSGTLDLGYHHPFSETSLPTPTPSPEPTPACTEIGAAIRMPSNYYRAGDPCYCEVYVCNPTDQHFADTALFVVLDVYGSYFFAPDFSSFDHYTLYFGPGTQIISVLPLFIWPDHAGSASGILFHCGMTDPEYSELIGGIDTFSFGWGD